MTHSHCRKLYGESGTSIFNYNQVCQKFYLQYPTYHPKVQISHLQLTVFLTDEINQNEWGVTISFLQFAFIRNTADCR